MWIEVFKTGTHVASNGKTFNITLGDLDRIISQYNPFYHEAPVVIGHPKHDAPAFGWVEALKREGSTLFAKLKDLVPEFLDMVKRGLYKKRSIALYPDFSLRHVGFLGGMVPAVKGLANIKFRQGGDFMKFSTKIDTGKSAGEILDEKIRDLLNNPPRVDHLGRALQGELTFSEAMSIVCRQNPELTRQYQKELS